MASVTSSRYDPNKHAVALDEDLEILTFAWSRKDDIALMRNPPSREHLASLKQAGLELPEVVPLREFSSLAGRKLGALRPWAWSPDAATLLQPLASGLSPASASHWRPALPPLWFSKEFGVRLETVLECGGGARVCRDADDAIADVDLMLRRGSILVKAAHSCAGKGHLRIEPHTPREPWQGWLKQALQRHGSVVIEPWLDRVTDFSALYEMNGGRLKLVGMTVMENDPVGRFTGTRVAYKWGSMLPTEVAAFLFGSAGVMEWYENRIPEALCEMLPDYHGPVGVDAMVFRKADGKLALKPVVEVNVRMTMGRVALELQKRPWFRGNGRLRILRKNQFAEWAHPPERRLALTDPASAREFVAVWEKS